MQINLMLIYILVPIFYLIVPFLILLFVKNKRRRKILVITLLIVFSVCLLIGVIGNFYTKDGIYNVYFDFNYISPKSVQWNILENSLGDMLINIIMLIPVGIAIVGLCADNKKRMLILLFTIGFVIGLIIETLQYILPINRAIQLADVLWNGVSVLLGGLIGMFYLKIISLFRNK